MREALEKDPARRPASANAGLAVLDQVAAPSGERMVPAGSRGRRTGGIVAAAVLAVMVAVTMIARREETHPAPQVDAVRVAEEGQPQPFVSRDAG